MKWKGENIYIPNKTSVQITRRDGTVLEFKLQAIEDMNSFEELYPEPKPPWVKNNKGQVTYQKNDAKYKEAFADWARKRMLWIILKSLEPTEDLEWESVDINDPESYELFEDELKEAGLNVAEINKITMAALEANSLKDEVIERAQEDF